MKAGSLQGEHLLTSWSGRDRQGAHPLADSVLHEAFGGACASEPPSELDKMCCPDPSTRDAGDSNAECSLGPTLVEQDGSNQCSLTPGPVGSVWRRFRLS